MDDNNITNNNYKSANHFLEIIYNYKTVKNINIEKNLETKLLRMYQQVRVSFNSIMCIKGTKGTNFFNNNYVLYKFFQLLELNDLTKNVPLIKSKLKIKYMDTNWQHVCEDLKWKFIPSI